MFERSKNSPLFLPSKCVSVNGVLIGGINSIEFQPIQQSQAEFMAVVKLMQISIEQQIIKSLGIPDLLGYGTNYSPYFGIKAKILDRCPKCRRIVAVNEIKCEDKISGMTGIHRGSDGEWCPGDILWST